MTSQRENVMRSLIATEDGRACLHNSYARGRSMKRGTVEFYRIGKWYGDQEHPYVFRFKQEGLEFTAPMSREQLDELLSTVAYVIEQEPRS